MAMYMCACIYAYMHACVYVDTYACTVIFGLAAYFKTLPKSVRLVKDTSSSTPPFRWNMFGNSRISIISTTAC